jgi:hypothetical protein
MGHFEIFRVTQAGRKAQIVVRGDMQAISRFVRDNGLTSHRDPRDPFGIFYKADQQSTTVYRVYFAMD